MALDIYQKSIYLMILNSTMILRSVGKSIKGKRTIKDFKICIFKEINKLTVLMDTGKLKENHILKSIKIISSEFKISFGQAQKAINVILKYHYYLTKKRDKKIKKALYCPLDSVILKELNRRGISLTKIDEKIYMEIQREINKKCFYRIEFDARWDNQNLNEVGI